MVEQETWVTLAALAGFALTLFTYLGASLRGLSGELAATRSELRVEIADTRTELKQMISGTDTRLSGEIGSLRTELKSDIAEFRREVRDEFSKLDGRITTLEQRSYDLSTRLPPAPAHPS